MQKHLFFKGTPIGVIDDPILTDGTWFGTFRESFSPESPFYERIMSFVEFCREWNSEQHSNSPPGPKGFDAFDDVIGERVWTVRDAEGNDKEVLDAPNFGNGDEVSWIEKDPLG